MEENHSNVLRIYKWFEFGNKCLKLMKVGIIWICWYSQEHAHTLLFHFEPFAEETEIVFPGIGKKTYQQSIIRILPRDSFSFLLSVSLYIQNWWLVRMFWLPRLISSCPLVTHEKVRGLKLQPAILSSGGRFYARHGPMSHMT